jgi:hypothetical protein
VLPHEEEYQHLLLLKSLLLLFEADPQTREKFWKVHQYVTTDFLVQQYGIPPNSPKPEVKNVVRLADYDSTSRRAVEELWQQTQQHWQDQLERKYYKLLGRQNQRGSVPQLTNYVSQEDIEALLESMLRSPLHLSAG